MNKNLTYINVHMHITMKPRKTDALTNTVGSSKLGSSLHSTQKSAEY